VTNNPGDLDLLSKLILDISGFKAGVDGAREGGKSLKGDLTKAFGAIGLEGVAQFLGVAGAIAGTIKELKACVDAAAENESSMFHLDSTLQSTGRNMSIDADQIARMASSLMQMSAFDDEAIVDAYTAIAKFETIKTDQMDAVVRSAMDMTAALGGNLAANAESIARVLETGVIPKTWGFAAALKEQIQKQIEAGDTAGALNAILGELGKRYGGQSQAELKTYNGMVKANTIAWKENEEIIGGKLLPILYNAQVGLNLLMTMNQKVTAALEDHEDQVLKTAKSYKAYAEEVIRAGMASESPGMTPSEIKARVEQYLREGATLEDLAQRYGGLTEEQQRLAQVTLNQVDYSERVASAMGDQAKSVEELAAMQRDYTDSLAFALGMTAEWSSYNKSLIAMEKELADARKAGYEETSGKVVDLKTRIEELKQAHSDATLEMVAGLYQYQLAQDGLTDIEMQKILDYRLAIGLMTKEQYQAAQDAIKLKDILESTNGSSEWKIFVTTYYATEGKLPFTNLLTTPDYTKLARGYATGTKGFEEVPPGYPNDSYPINLTSGEKYAVIPPGGSPSNGGGIGTGGGSPVIVQLQYSPLISTASEAELERALWPFIQRGLHSAGVATQ
jgi:hypothetical protein